MSNREKAAQARRLLKVAKGRIRDRAAFQAVVERGTQDARAAIGEAVIEYHAGPDAPGRDAAIERQMAARAEEGERRFHADDAQVVAYRVAFALELYRARDRLNSGAAERPGTVH